MGTLKDSCAAAQPAVRGKKLIQRESIDLLYLSMTVELNA